MMDLQRYIWAGLSAEQQLELLKRSPLNDQESHRADVADIIASVREHGDSALFDYAMKFDQAELRSLKVTGAEFQDARQKLTDDQVAAIDAAIANVRCFHEQQRTAAIDIETIDGVRCQRVSHPIDSVGLYVPAGSAPLPSTAIMLAVPAVIAGCPECILCTPCQSDGQADAAVLTAAFRAGVTSVFKLGGAQAIAAMAYGTESVPAVQKIFGPGNAWVTTAKTIVGADPYAAAIDMPAGPSEVLVIADDSANAEFVASDLLSQAEHGPDSQAILVCTSSKLAANVVDATRAQLRSLPRKSIAAAAIKHSKIIEVRDLEEAVGISNQYAPEHLIVQTRDPRALLPSIRNAGSVFLGPWSPESVGDYCSGTNHVLPTHGAAKRYSSLGLEQFVRHMTVQELTRDGLKALAPTVIELAALEGLAAHASAVRCRLAHGVADA
jgi:histidinol dehydrogenase